MRIVYIAILILLSTISVSAQGKYDYLINIHTEYGDMKLLLFDDTPIHKENFLKLAKSGQYDSTIFHRVIKNFMIQGGAIKHNNQAEWDSLTYKERTLRNEIMDRHKHVHGALAAARIEDPEKRSDISQFYIVQNHSGSHFLDNKYTVFGQLIIGFEVLDKIVNQKLKGSTPVKPIYMTIKVDKVKRKDVVKFYGNVYDKK